MKLSENENDIAAICKQYNISKHKINSDGTIDVTGNVNLSKKKFSTLPLKFGKVTGNFYCYECPNLTSLEGAPNEVGGNFYCRSCSNLTSLNRAPSKVGGNFSCNSCHNLTSLVDAPSKVGGDFYCYDCPNLISLEGVPSEVGGDFICNDCPKLTKLSHLISINGKLFIENTPITNLLAIFGIENLKEIAHETAEITNIINKYLKNPDRDDGMFQCRQELKDTGFGEYARLK